jgi:hypothetical protein
MKIKFTWNIQPFRQGEIARISFELSEVLLSRGHLKEAAEMK